MQDSSEEAERGQNMIEICSSYKGFWSVGKISQGILEPTSRER